MSVASDLDAASTAIKNEDWRSALESLLVAWRARRIERLAELIDRVSARLPSEPVKGKTVKARTEAWLALAKRESAADVGSLIATPWPGKWQDCLIMLEAYDSFQSDPRIALAIATFLVTAKFETRSSVTFYEVALRILGKSRDFRTRELLETRLALTPSRLFAHLGRIRESTLSLMTERPALEPDEEAALAKLEALFASEIHTETANEKSAADFLSAIYASPEDDTLRAVYADWLTERGDPRGEFITLQLHGDTSPKPSKRQASLLKKHGAAFAGALDRVFVKDQRIWTRGFLTGGVVYDSANLVSELDHPEWSLIDTLYLTSFRGIATKALVAAPWLKNLRSLAGVPEAMVAQMAVEGLGPNLEELDMLLSREDDGDVERRQRIAEGFPRLKRFGIGYDREPIIAYLGQPLPKVERLVLISHRVSPNEALPLVPAGVPICEMRGAFGTHSQWRFEFHRDERGRFTRLRAGPSDPRFTLCEPRPLGYVLESVPELEELIVEPGAGHEWGRDALASVEASIAAAKNLRRIDVPWDRGVGARDAAAPRIKLWCRLRSGIAKDLDAIWQALASSPFGFEFDSFAVNFGAHEALEGDALERLKETLGKKRTHSVALYRKRTAETMVATFRSQYFELTIPRSKELDLDAYLGWLVALVDRTDTEFVGAPFFALDDDGAMRERYTRRVGPYSEPLRWIMGFGEEMPFALDELEAGVDGGGVRVMRAKRVLLLVFGDSPEAPMTDEAQERFDERLTRSFWTKYERTHGFTPEGLTRDLLGAALVARGFEADAVKPIWTRNGASIRFQKRAAPNGSVAFGAEFRRADDTAQLADITPGFVATKENASKALEAFIEKLAPRVAWLEAPTAGKFPR